MALTEEPRKLRWGSESAPHQIIAFVSGGYPEADVDFARTAQYLEYAHVTGPDSVLGDQPQGGSVKSSCGMTLIQIPAGQSDPGAFMRRQVEAIRGPRGSSCEDYVVVSPEEHLLWRASMAMNRTRQDEAGKQRSYGPLELHRELWCSPALHHVVSSALRKRVAHVGVSGVAKHTTWRGLPHDFHGNWPENAAWSPDEITDRSWAAEGYRPPSELLIRGKLAALATAQQTERSSGRRVIPRPGGAPIGQPGNIPPPVVTPGTRGRAIGPPGS